MGLNMKTEIKIALIGASATIVAAFVVAVFELTKVPEGSAIFDQEQTDKVNGDVQNQVGVASVKNIVMDAVDPSAGTAPIVDIQALFSPTGWMGDGEQYRDYIKFSAVDKGEFRSPPHSIKVTYRFGPKYWAGLYWQNVPDNWGDKRGADYSEKSISRATFWARGKTGREVVEFKVGGIENSGKQYRDSLSVTTHRIGLTTEWEKHEIDLTDENMSSVIGGFGWIASKDYNADSEITFYLDDIVFE